MKSRAPCNLAALTEMDRSASLPPRPFNVLLSPLSAGYAFAIRKAIDDGLLEAHTLNGETWVCQSELLDLAGPGADCDDPNGGCYIPGAAKIDRDAGGL